MYSQSGDPSLRINVNPESSTCDVELIGCMEHTITDEEIELFGLTDSKVKDAVRYSKGGRPNQIYLKSPTPWNDVFKKYKWDQVSVDINPVSSRILSTHEDVEIITHLHFDNPSNFKAAFNGSISRQVSETVSNTWTNAHEIKISKDVNFEIKFNSSGVGSRSEISYTGSWGKSNTKSKTVTLAASAGVSIDLDPGQAVRATLKAKKRTVELQVVYEAELDGGVACNFEQEFKGHNHWWYPLDDLDLVKSKRIKQKITVEYYFDVTVVVENVRV